MFLFKILFKEGAVNNEIQTLCKKIPVFNIIWYLYNSKFGAVNKKSFRLFF